MGEKLTQAEANQRLIDMAREINPALPADLSGHHIRIELSRSGLFASAFRSTPPSEIHAKGGHARAAALSAERRSEIARGAACKRWDSGRAPSSKDTPND